MTPLPPPKRWLWWLPWWHRFRLRRDGAGGCRDDTIAVSEEMALVVAVASCVWHTEVCVAHWPWQPASRAPKCVGRSPWLLARDAPKRTARTHRGSSLVVHRGAPLALIAATRSWCTEAHRSRSPRRLAANAPKWVGYVHRSYSRSVCRSLQATLTLTTRPW